jgi:hypothetical protein
LPFFINAGVYALRKLINDYIRAKGVNEVRTLPRGARDKKLYGVSYSAVHFKSIDTLKDLEEADKAINEQRCFQ